MRFYLLKRKSRLEPTMTTRKFFASSGRPRRRGSLLESCGMEVRREGSPAGEYPRKSSYSTGSTLRILSRLASLRRGVRLGSPQCLSRTRSATAGKSERELQWTCFHRVKRCGTPASAWLQRAWLGNADYSDQCLAKKLAVACPHLSGSSIHISCVAPGTVTCSALGSR